MKRTQIEAAIAYAKELLNKYNFHLPMFGYWNLEDWKANADKLETIRQTKLGWDVTDFSSGDFTKVGAVLFTIRNGVLGHPEIGCPYAEKLIIMKKDQELPLHFHYNKTEDIINRGGGTLCIQVYGSKEDQTVDYESDVPVDCDGIHTVVKAGTVVEIAPGNSMTIRPGMYHLFLAKGDDVIVGEVSAVNDDSSDNHFAKEQSYFNATEEDTEITVPLGSEYEKLLFGK